jgi:hypothetical protein
MRVSTSFQKERGPAATQRRRLKPPISWQQTLPRQPWVARRDPPAQHRSPERADDSNLESRRQRSLAPQQSVCLWLIREPPVLRRSLELAMKSVLLPVALMARDQAALAMSQSRSHWTLLQKANDSGLSAQQLWDLARKQRRHTPCNRRQNSDSLVRIMSKPAMTSPPAHRTVPPWRSRWRDRPVHKE